MAPQPRLILHTIPFSHPCLAVSGALDRLGLDYEEAELATGRHAEEIERIYGEGRRTVPGLLVDEEPVHGTAAIFARLDQLCPDAGLYPEAVAEAVREAEAGLAQELQQTARFLIFGSLHFRPDAMGTFAGIEALDPAGVDYTIKLLRGTWRYIGITAVGVHERLQALPGQLDAVDELIAAGVIGGERPTAADFQLASSLWMLAQIGDVRPLLEGRPAALARAWFDPGPANIPAGAFPPGWVPQLQSQAAPGFDPDRG